MSNLKMAWNNQRGGINFWLNYVVWESDLQNVIIWHVIHWLYKHIQIILKQNSWSFPLVVIPPTLFNHWNSLHTGLFSSKNISLIILLNFPGKKKILWTFIFHSNLLNLNSFNRHRHSNVQRKCTWSAQGQK